MLVPTLVIAKDKLLQKCLLDPLEKLPNFIQLHLHMAYCQCHPTPPAISDAFDTHDFIQGSIVGAKRMTAKMALGGKKFLKDQHSLVWFFIK